MCLNSQVVSLPALLVLLQPQTRLVVDSARRLTASTNLETRSSDAHHGISEETLVRLTALFTDYLGYAALLWCSAYSFRMFTREHYDKGGFMVVTQTTMIRLFRKQVGTVSTL